MLLGKCLAGGRAAGRAGRPAAGRSGGRAVGQARRSGGRAGGRPDVATAGCEAVKINFRSLLPKHTFPFKSLYKTTDFEGLSPLKLDSVI